MIEELLARFSELTPIWIYILLFSFAFIENLFPPSPSDIAIVIGGSLVGTGYLDFLPSLLFATLGGVTGFLAAFAIGWQFDKKLIHAGKLKFINVQSIDKVEKAFQKYGYYLIVANRFLAGTRAVISFFAGMSKLNITLTIILSALSSLIWNTILLYLGIAFGKNVVVVDQYLGTYSNIVIIISIVIVLFFLLKYLLTKKKK